MTWAAHPLLQIFQSAIGASVIQDADGMLLSGQGAIDAVEKRSDVIDFIQDRE